MTGFLEALVISAITSLVELEDYACGGLCIFVPFSRCEIPGRPCFGAYSLRNYCFVVWVESDFISVYDDNR
jgi:hypothetical protein